jgi:hypothetical protein
MEEPTTTPAKKGRKPAAKKAVAKKTRKPRGKKKELSLYEKAKAYLTPIVKDILNPRDLALIYLVIEGALKHFG